MHSELYPCTANWFYECMQTLAQTQTLLFQESETLAGTLSRCLSLVFDWGTEAGVWRSPSTFIQEELPWDTLFGCALPIPDHDHSLHHASCPPWTSHVFFSPSAVSLLSEMMSSMSRRLQYFQFFMFWFCLGFSFWGHHGWIQDYGMLGVELQLGHLFPATFAFHCLVLQ